MATKVHMEALSPTMEEGRLVKWLKHEGDAVKTGDTLAEVETDKAVMDLVARADGTLLKVMSPEGSTLSVGTVVAYIGKPGEKVENGSGESGVVPSLPKPAATPAAPVPTPALVRRETLPTPHSPAPATAQSSTSRIKASPLARRVADERGVDLKLVQGSGPGGRVVLRDVENAGSGELGVVPSGAAAPAATRKVPLPTPHSPYEDVPLTQDRKSVV